MSSSSSWRQFAVPEDVKASLRAHRRLMPLWYVGPLDVDHSGGVDSGDNKSAPRDANHRGHGNQEQES